MVIDISSIESMASMALADKKLVNADEVRNIVKGLRSIASEPISDQEVENIARKLEARHNITMGIGQVLTDREYEPWLEGRQSEIEPYYWERYRKYLIQRGFSNQVVAALGAVTDRTLGLLENPEKPGQWDRRGMVVGHVQSGKTANYVGLINKAADAGYKLIVVIAGIQNNLRNQTQIRVDEGFIGRDSARLLSGKADRLVGVGKLDPTRPPAPFTNSKRDFNKATATGVGIPLQTLKTPAIFVIKKNTLTLKNLIAWLREYNALGLDQSIDVPLLLIDDEADNASVNTSRDPNKATRINGQIRTLLSLFDRSCYVGYTATPFANIFIDPESADEMLGDDLFPKNFIINLDPPSNYFGPENIFGDETGGDHVRPIADNEACLPMRQQKEMRVLGLPDSLRTAIRTFVVARAIRLVRGHKHEHCSMMVNASRFTNVQSQLRNIIQAELDGIKNSIRLYSALAPSRALRNSEIEFLHKVWTDQYASIGESWAEVQSKLRDAAAPIKVVEVNNRSSDSLNYGDHDKGLSVIAVGGYSLSRGLTLEGLTVSYFLRNSKMYDTLMQMGRWFGYRPDYDDLCRVWMTEEAAGWYAHISESIEQLRSEIRQMQTVNATPEEFGLKVRAHPDTLMVTARNKMGSSEKLTVSVGLGNSFVETAILRSDAQSLAGNREAAIALAHSIRANDNHFDPYASGWFTRNVPVPIILDFLVAYLNHPASVTTDPELVRQYISGRLEELGSWDVLFAGVSTEHERSLVDESLGFKIICQRRKKGDRSVSGGFLVTNRQRVASRGVEKAGLTNTQIEMAQREYMKDLPPRPVNGKKPNFPDYIYRSVRNNPLLVLHLLAIGEIDEDLSDQAPYVAWSMSFPRTRSPQPNVEYVVNTSWIREHFSDDDEDEELEDEYL